MPESNPPGIIGDIIDERIVMGHGAGGRKMHRLIRQVFLKHFDNPVLARMGDAAVVPSGAGRTAMSTDSYVVQPLFFPGGDIGKLAVCGTVNDVAMAGAEPAHLSVGFIIREGLELGVLDRVCRSMARTAKLAGVTIVTGDTKVIEKGEDEGLYINTTGIGRVWAGVRFGPEHVRPGDALLINGTVGDHEAAIAVARGVYRFRANVRSDCAPLNRLTGELVVAGGVRMMRDPTRGGVATTLNEIADSTGLGFIIEETALPVSKPVRGIAELLGMDPLYMANEGKVIVIADRRHGDSLVRLMHAHRYGRRGRQMGQVVAEPRGVWLRTRLGSLRRLIMLEGEQLPRIC